MSSSNLIPTPIVNKNGVHTTVYKAADSQPSGSSLNLPAPMVSKVVNNPSATILKRLTLTMHAPYVTVPSSISAKQLERTLNGYPEDTQAYIADVLERDKDGDSYLDRVIISMLDNRRSPEEIEDTLFIFESLPNSWGAFTYESDWGDDGFDVEITLLKAVAGARGYAPENYEYGNEDYSLLHYSERTQQQVLALVELLFEMDSGRDTNGGLRYSDTSYYINDERIVQFVAENPERSMEVSNLMRERGHEWESIAPVLTASSVPLREGSL